jgi:hypothetical protein
MRWKSKRSQVRELPGARTIPEHRHRVVPWPLLLALAVIVLTPLAVIGPTLVDGHGEINVVLGGKRLYIGRTRAVPASPGVTRFLSGQVQGWTISTGSPDTYHVFFGDGAYTTHRNSDGKLVLKVTRYDWDRPRQ